MIYKILANKHNPYTGTTIVQLEDACGNYFSAQILPFNKLNLSILPKDRVLEKLIDLKSDHQPLRIKKKLANFFSPNRNLDSIYVIANLPTDSKLPNLVFGYAEFEVNREENCLDLLKLYSSKKFDPDKKYNNKLFGKNMIAFGLYLNRQIFGDKMQKALHVPVIDAGADDFYKDLKFIRYGIYESKGFLTKEIAEELFG